MSVRRLGVLVCTLSLLALSSETLFAVRLSSLTLSTGPTSPAFNSGVFQYTASVASTVTSVRVTVTAPFASIRVNGVLTASGSPSAPISLAPGPNTVTITATGFFTRTTDTYTVVVTRQGAGDNTPPTIDITSPSSAMTVNEGASVALTGVASDAQDGTLDSRIAWTSVPSGLTGNGPSATATLPPGQYTISASVTDNAGVTTTDSVSLTVNGIPVITINSPAEGTSVLEGTSLTFLAAASDFEQGDISAAVSWVSSRDGLIGTGGSFSGTLSNGIHAITASVSDARGAAGTDSVTLTVRPPGSTSSRPNILLIVADDVGAESTSLYPEIRGTSTPIQTPNIEALAAGGLVFTNAWASPLCSPTRATILSGLYGHRTGVVTVGNRLPTTTDSLFKYIARESPAAYGMGAFGKWHLSGTNGNGTSADAAHVRDTGVPAFWGFFGGGISNYFNWTAYDVNGLAYPGTGYATSENADQAIDFIQAHEASRPSDPWFAYVPFNAAHSPYHTPPSNLLLPGTSTVDNRAKFKAALQALDTEIGRLLSVVDLERTVVIFMGDNGTPADVKPAGTRLRNSKTSVYEGGVRVPLVIAGAGVTRTGREDALVVSTDLYATIAALTGIPVTQIHNSFSLVPVLSTAGATTGRTHAFTEVCGGTTWRGHAIRDSRFKLLVNNGVWGLYDLSVDPSEATNLYSNASYSSIRTQLEAQLQALKPLSTSPCFQ